jgi:hypothetical protein
MLSKQPMFLGIAGRLIYQLRSCRARTIGPGERQTVGILWETSCNNVGNSEQNEQMKKRPSVRANLV